MQDDAALMPFQVSEDFLSIDSQPAPERDGHQMALAILWNGCIAVYYVHDRMVDNLPVPTGDEIYATDTGANVSRLEQQRVEAEEFEQFLQTPFSILGP